MTILPEAGKYEIFIHRPHLLGSCEGKRSTTDYPGMKNYYTVYTPAGKEEIILEVPEGDPRLYLPSTLPEEDAWVSLGKFTLPAGESRVVLDDRGVALVQDKTWGDHFQLVIADAVKWVKVK